MQNDYKQLNNNQDDELGDELPHPILPKSNTPDDYAELKSTTGETSLPTKEQLGYLGRTGYSVLEGLGAPFKGEQDYPGSGFFGNFGANVQDVLRQRASLASQHLMPSIAKKYSPKVGEYPVVKPSKYPIYETGFGKESLLDPVAVDEALLKAGFTGDLRKEKDWREQAKLEGGDIYRQAVYKDPNDPSKGKIDPITSSVAETAGAMAGYGILSSPVTGPVNKLLGIAEGAPGLYNYYKALPSSVAEQSVPLFLKNLGKLGLETGRRATAGYAANYPIGLLQGAVTSEKSPSLESPEQTYDYLADVLKKGHEAGTYGAVGEVGIEALKTPFLAAGDVGKSIGKYVLNKPQSTLRDWIKDFEFGYANKAGTYSAESRGIDVDQPQTTKSYTTVPEKRLKTPEQFIQPIKEIYDEAGKDLSKAIDKVKDKPVTFKLVKEKVPGLNNLITRNNTLDPDFAKLPTTYKEFVDQRTRDEIPQKVLQKIEIAKQNIFGKDIFNDMNSADALDETFYQLLHIFRPATSAAEHKSLIQNKQVLNEMGLPVLDTPLKELDTKLKAFDDYISDSLYGENRKGLNSLAKKTRSIRDEIRSFTDDEIPGLKIARERYKNTLNNLIEPFFPSGTRFNDSAPDVRFNEFKDNVFKTFRGFKNNDPYAVDTINQLFRRVGENPSTVEKYLMNEFALTGQGAKQQIPLTPRVPTFENVPLDLPREKQQAAEFFSGIKNEPIMTPKGQQVVESLQKEPLSKQQQLDLFKEFNPDIFDINKPMQYATPAAEEKAMAAALKNTTKEKVEQTPTTEEIIDLIANMRGLQGGDKKAFIEKYSQGMGKFIDNLTDDYKRSLVDSILPSAVENSKSLPRYIKGGLTGENPMAEKSTFKSLLQKTGKKVREFEDMNLPKQSLEKVSTIKVPFLDKLTQMKDDELSAIAQKLIDYEKSLSPEKLAQLSGKKVPSAAEKILSQKSQNVSKMGQTLIDSMNQGNTLKKNAILYTLLNKPEYVPFFQNLFK